MRESPTPLAAAPLRSAPPPCPCSWQFPQLAAVAVLLLSSTGRICANPNFQRVDRALRCWAAPATCELAVAPGAACTAVSCPLCMRCQVALVLAAFAAVGHCLYASELRQRRAFLATRPDTPQRPSCDDAMSVDGPPLAPASGLGPGLLDYWLSFALPATCALFSFVAASQL